MKRRNLLSALVAGMAGLAGCGGNGEEPQQASTDTSTATEVEPSMDTRTSTETETATETPAETTAEAVIGDVVEGERLSMVMRNVSRTTQIGEYQQAESGNTFIVIRLAVKNTTSDRFADFSGFFQTTLTDDEDYNYDPTIAVTDNTFQRASLPQGKSPEAILCSKFPTTHLD